MAGKTGTAQTNTGKPRAWFVCLAPAANPRIVVAVVVLNKAVLQAALGG